ncbi:acyl-CoA thioesterase [Sporothrix eucalyptigena]
MSLTPTPATGHRRLLTDAMFSVTPVPADGPDIFKSTESLWYPIWARGIYGGALIAQSLTAAQETLPPTFFVHSMHCHFVRAAQVDLPLVYHVDRIRDGASVSLRTVRTHQNGQLVFSTTISFAKPAKSTKVLQHQAPFPDAAKQGPPTSPGGAIDSTLLSKTCQVEFGSMFECVRLSRDTRETPEKERLLQWMRVRADDTQVNLAGTIQAHLAALAYMTDNYFIGTVLRAHRGSRFTGSEAMKGRIQALNTSTEKGQKKLKAFQNLAQEEWEDNDGSHNTTRQPTAEMMVSLDHTIFFHEPAAVRADDWLLVEAETPWAGHERGLVIERIWTSSGVLVATCIQEGMVRLQQEKEATSSTAKAHVSRL